MIKISILAEGRTGWTISGIRNSQSRRYRCSAFSKITTPKKILFRINHSNSKAIVVSLQTYDKILPVYLDIEAPDFKLIFLDEDITDIKTKLAEAQIKDKNILTFNQLLDEGKKNLSRARR